MEDNTEINPYLNTPPTEIKRKLNKAKGKEKQLLEEAYIVWSLAQRYDRLQDVNIKRSSVMNLTTEILKVAKELVAEQGRFKKITQLEEGGHTILKMQNTQLV